jgi:hypothetical protein
LHAQAATIAVQLSDVGRSRIGAALAIAMILAAQFHVLRNALLSFGSQVRQPLQLRM